MTNKELDEFIAKEVFGCILIDGECHCSSGLSFSPHGEMIKIKDSYKKNGIKKYSKSIELSFMALEQMRRKKRFRFYIESEYGEEWSVYIAKRHLVMLNSYNSKNLPYAICMAIKKVLGGDDE